MRGSDSLFGNIFFQILHKSLPKGFCIIRRSLVTHLNNIYTRLRILGLLECSGYGFLAVLLFIEKITGKIKAYRVLRSRKCNTLSANFTFHIKRFFVNGKITIHFSIRCDNMPSLTYVSAFFGNLLLIRVQSNGAGLLKNICQRKFLFLFFNFRKILILRKDIIKSPQVLTHYHTEFFICLIIFECIFRTILHPLLDGYVSIHDLLKFIKGDFSLLRRIQIGCHIFRQFAQIFQSFLILRNQAVFFLLHFKKEIAVLILSL